MLFALIEGDKNFSSGDANPVVFGPRTGFEDRLLEAKGYLDELIAAQNSLIDEIKTKLKALTTDAG